MTELFTLEPEAKVAYADQTNSSTTSAWHICTCHKCRMLSRTMMVAGRPLSIGKHFEQLGRLFW